MFRLYKIRKLYQRIKYRKQLKAGFGLLSDVGAKKEFVIVDGRAFIVNGADPMVRVDLDKGTAQQYKKRPFLFTYKVRFKKNV